MLSDVCNSFISDEYAPVLVRKAAFRMDLDKRIKDNYRRLFLETDGVIKITSSESGEYSFGTDIGGMFTNAFIESLDLATKSGFEADWRDILDHASASVVDDQHPVYIIE